MSAPLIRTALALLLSAGALHSGQAWADDIAPLDKVWADVQVDALRWQGAPASTFTAPAGQELEVVVVKADWLRVRKGADFGWVPVGAVLTDNPAPAAAAPQMLDLSQPPSLK